MADGKHIIKSTEDLFTINDRGCVKLRLDNTSFGSRPPITIPDLFKRTVEEFPENDALVYKNEDNEWKALNYREYQQKVFQVAKAFIKLGFEVQDTVGVIAFNSKEWFYSELGAIHAGGKIAGIYTTNSAEAVHNILHTSRAKIIVVDDSKQMAKIRAIKDRLPSLKVVIQINGPFDDYITSEEGYYKWSDIEDMETNDMDNELQRRIDGVSVNECCCFIYTSGTVGYPKGVMLSHDNITWDARALLDRFENVTPGHETVVSYLPMSHMAAQMLDIFIPITIGGTTYFADRDALKGTLVDTLQVARPTRFMGVPRVFEKIFDKLKAMESNTSYVKKAILNWARSVSLNHNLAAMKGITVDNWKLKIARNLVLNKIKVALGFDKVQSLIAGGAPISTEIKKYFLSLDMHLCEVYGLSESTGGHCLSTSKVPNLETVGKPLDGIETIIFNPDENGVGEVCLRSRSVFMGYLDDMDKTLQALDEDGWLHSGDLGYMDDDGYVYITGRLKELIITAGGENIPPVHVEDLIKAELPALSNVFLVGDKRKYLAALVTLKTEMDPNTGMPKDQLDVATLKLMENLGLTYTTLSEILDAGPCPVVQKAITEAIDRANKNSISNAQKVQKFALLSHDFSIGTGELGPTLKLRRNVVSKMYEDVIDKLYK